MLIAVDRVSHVMNEANGCTGSLTSTFGCGEVKHLRQPIEYEVNDWLSSSDVTDPLIGILADHLVGVLATRDGERLQDRAPLDEDSWAIVAAARSLPAVEHPEVDAGRLILGAVVGHAGTA